MEEVWKETAESSRYEVSTEGRVRNAKTKYVLNPHLDKQGRPRVSLYDDEGRKKNIFVKSLVADVFLPSDPEKPNVRNKDGNQLNNRHDNLERIPIGKKVRVVETDKIYSTIRKCAKDTGLNESSISKCCNYPFYNNKKKIHFESVE